MEKKGPLAVVVQLLGLIAGVVTLIYALGGLIIALRLFFDDFATIHMPLVRTPMIAA